MISRSICPSMKFKAEGVVVHHDDPAQTVRVRRKAIPDNIPMAGIPGFTPFRLVINLGVDDPAQAGPVFHLNKPMKVQVEYTQADENRAGGYQNLKLGYWDGNAWFAFNGQNKFRLVPYSPPGTGGVGIVEISDWIDPTKAWGT